MVSQTEFEECVLRGYGRPVLAMRKAHQGRRFGLIFGAGVSKAFNFDVPDWKQLLGKIASNPKVQGETVDSLDASLTSRADLLYSHFAARVRSEIEEAEEGNIHAVTPDRPDPRTIDRIITGEWRALIREVLYEHAPQPDHLRAAHAYLGEYLDVIIKSPLTITYNFDSYLEMMLACHPGTTEARGRAYEIVFDGSVPFRSQDGVIYHPNGYLPRNVLERASDDLVFSEEQFGDQLLDSIAGRYSSIANHLSKNICLLIGLSLADENLRHFLRRNATNNPGHFHYLVEHLRSDDDIVPERREALFDYRFNVYNLITLFLTDAQIGALGRLIHYPFAEFRPIAERAEVRKKYVFYLTGIPGIGKTTVLRHLASLSTYDEWVSDPLPLLAKPHEQLTDDEERHLDDWIAKQFRVKNEALLNEPEGIFVVERAPLDPVSFVARDKIAAKAAWYRPRIVPTLYDEICPGRVLLLWGNTEKVTGRIASRQTIRQPSDYLEELQTKLRDSVYVDRKVSHIFSTSWTIRDLVREVARVIHLGHDEDVDLQGLLESLEHPAPGQQ